MTSNDPIQTCSIRFSVYLDRCHLCRTQAAELSNCSGAPGQLYNLKQDAGETNNLYFANEAKRKEMQALLERLKSSGRSAPKLREPIGMENIPTIKKTGE